MFSLIMVTKDARNLGVGNLLQCTVFIACNQKEGRAWDNVEMPLNCTGPFVELSTLGIALPYFTTVLKLVQC